MTETEHVTIASTDGANDDSAMPTWAAIRTRLVELARQRGDWSGIPLPVDGLAMALERKYPYQGLADVFGQTPEETRLAAISDELSEQVTVVNHWYSWAKQAYVYVYRESGGKSKVLVDLRGSSVAERSRKMLETLHVAAAECWCVAAELEAMMKLLSLVTEQAFKCYMLCGMFLETSPRSHVTYLFRKLRPTLALRPAPPNGNMGVIAALCLHPIGYYVGTYAGAMVPTDDVLAHLTLMRGDEHRFWRLANQHPLWAPESGV